MPQIDIEQPDQLLSYLRETGRIAPAESPIITVLAGGVSNRTVMVERATGEAWVLKQALAKLRVKVDWFSDPVRIEREAAGLRHLPTLAPPGAITPLVFEDPTQHLLAMQAVPKPHANWKTMLLAGNLKNDHVEQFADLLAGVHRNAWLRRDELAAFFADRSFFESLRLEPYYAYTASQVPESASFYDRLIADTRSRRFTIVHGDYSPKNVLVHGNRLILLDHEVIHWGDPSFDLGFALTHLLSKAHHLPAMRRRFADAAVAFWSHYREGIDDVPWAGDQESFAVWQTLGCLLARVAGRSPLEYLSAADQSRQRRVVVALMERPPMTIPELTQQFNAMLSAPP